MKIGNVEIENPLVLAPLDGVNCTAFRLLCKEYGAGLIYTAMVDVDRFVKEKNPIKTLINPQDDERPLVVQIVGSNEKNLVIATRMISKVADIIDFNLGCTEGDILGKKAGCYLMKHPDNLNKLIPAIIENSTVPVTCKLRAGWDKPNAVEVAKQLEKLGVSAISIHPRTKKQGYRGKADWDIIKKVKEAVDIPVIGNGDVNKPYHAVTMMGQTKCDAVMIGRAAMGNPFIFKRILYLMRTGEQSPEPSEREFLRAFRKLVDIYKDKEVRSKLSELMDHACWFVKGFRKTNTAKVKIRKSKNQDQIVAAIRSSCTE